MARVTVNEGSTSYHAISAVNKEGEAVAPEAMRYKVTGEAGAGLVAWTTIDPSTTEIEVSSTVNTVGTAGKKRYLTVEVTHGGGDKITEELEYTLVDLKGI